MGRRLQVRSAELRAMRLVLVFAAALALATVAGLAFAAYVMRAPPRDVQQLALILAGAGATSLLAGGAAVRSLLFGYAVSGALVADLDRVSRAARRLAAGDLTTRAGLDGRGEVAQLGMAFDQMAGQLQASIERERAQERARREMVAAVSHDLRTPLTTMRAMVEAMTDGVVTEAGEVRRYLDL